MANRVNGSLWIKIVLSIAVPALILAAAWGATKFQMDQIKTVELPALKEADKEQSDAIDANENAIIKIEGKIETLRVEQRTYHDHNVEKLDEILKAVEK